MAKLFEDTRESYYMESVSHVNNLRLAIQFNLVVPGLGYLYIGKKIIGIGAVLFIIGIYVASGLRYLLQTYIVMNAIMAIDMAI